MQYSRLQVPCPYKGWVQYETHTVNSSVEVSDVALKLGNFCASYSRKPGRSFLIYLCPVVHSNSITGLCNVFHNIVRQAQFTSSALDTMYQNILDEHWRLVINDTNLFAVTASPCYTETHPRYNPDISVILFQPEELFSSLGITTDKNRVSFTEKAVTSFKKSGRRYFHHHTSGTPKSLRFILDENGEGIRWWDTFPVHFS